MTIYKEIILESFKNPKNYGKMAHASKSIAVANPLCGDVISMSVKLKGDKIEDIKFVGAGCVISQALSSRLTQYVKGKKKTKLRKLDRDFMIKLLGIELGPNRIKCAMLPLEALQKLLS